MKREKLNTLQERDILIGLITSDRFCREVIPVLNPRYLQVEYARIIAGWVKSFYDDFKEAPKQDIMKLYRSHIEEISDESLQDNILTFIEKLNKDYENKKTFNDEFALSESINYLKSQQLKNLSEDINSHLINGDVSKAEDIITKFKSVEKSSGKAVSLLHNKAALIQSFTENNEILFTIPGAYGTVIGDLHREDFVSFLAPMKRGKTWQLIDVGCVALLQGMNVLHVSCEMSESQTEKRYWTALSGQTNKDIDEINYPYFDELGDKFIIEHKTISRKRATPEEIEKKQKSLNRMCRGSDIRIIAVPQSTLTVDALDLEIDKLEQQEDFIPDVIIVDYADILAPKKGVNDYRQQLDSIWKGLRSLAQKRKAIVFTASQSGRASLSKNVESEDIAEDIRKLAHVTSMVSINQTPKEKQEGYFRLKQLAVREGEQEFRQAVCLQCLNIGRMVLDSHFDNEVKIMKENQSSENDSDDEDEEIINRKRNR